MSERITLNRDAPVYVAGHAGVVGKALVRRLERAGFGNIVKRTRSEVDLTNRDAVFAMFAQTKPSYVIISAGKVGGIAANMAAPVEFLLDNLKIQNNLLEACMAFGVEITAFLGSSCVYPRECPQPMKESYFMTGPLEPTNESYAVAKIAGIRLAQAFHAQHGMRVLCPMPCNVYGQGDHFEFERSHVVSAMVRRFTEAKRTGAPSVKLWGTGSARREFLHVDDLADACLFLMERHDKPDLINVGSGIDYSIRELAEMTAAAVNYEGRLEWDPTKPDGMPRKLLDVSRLHALGWRHQIELEQGLLTVMQDFERRYPAEEGSIA